MRAAAAAAAISGGPFYRCAAAVPWHCGNSKGGKGAENGAIPSPTTAKPQPNHSQITVPFPPETVAISLRC